MAFMRYAILASATLALASAQQCSSGNEKCETDNVEMLQVGTKVSIEEHPGNALAEASAREEEEGEDEQEHQDFILGPVFERGLKTSSTHVDSLLQPASVAKRISTTGCSCTWNAAYPCELHGSCYSYSTKASCEGAGGNFCGSGNAPPMCTCTFNPSYQCQLNGGCWGYQSKSGCEGAGGEWCGTSSPTPAPAPPPPTPAPAPPPPTPAGTPPSNMIAALNRHNELRKEHQAPDLTWDDSLMQDAQTWADGCKWEHSTMGHGENLWAGTGSFDAAKATQDWYDELINPGYDFNNPGFTSGTGHFTQVVWKSTTKLGCAVTQCSTLQGPGWKNAWNFVCEYSPPGNYRSQFPTNVLPKAR